MAKIHTTNYYNTLILVAEDTKATTATVPPTKEGKVTVANIQFDLLYHHPYQYTSDEIIFDTFAMRNNISKQELAAAKSDFFSKGQACMRTSALAKTYGWGIHHNSEGKVALVAIESEQYAQLTNDENVAKVKAMKQSK